MTDSRIEDRWAEVKFYFIVLELFSLRNKIHDVVNNIRYHAVNKEFDPEIVIECAQIALQSPTARPSRDEAIMLMKHYGVRVKEIKRRAKVHNRTIYSLLEKLENQDIHIYPKFSKTQNSHITQYVNAFYEIKGIGIEI